MSLNPKTTILFLTMFAPNLLTPAHAQGGAGDPAYLERRNDQGIVGYCTGKGFLEADSETYFRIGTEEVFGPVKSTAEADLHEQKGRDGISYLRGEEQTLSDLAKENGVDLAKVCGQYKGQITLGKLMAKRKAGN